VNLWLKFYLVSWTIEVGFFRSKLGALSWGFAVAVLFVCAREPSELRQRSLTRTAGPDRSSRLQLFSTGTQKLYA
jgi:hypothetical protein